MGFKVENEKFTHLGSIDIVLNERIYVEIMGEIHYFNGKLDWKIKRLMKTAELYGNRMILIRD